GAGDRRAVMAPCDRVYRLTRRAASDEEEDDTMSASDDELVDLTVTGPDVETMAGLVRGLVEAGLAACGNLVPGVRSIYTWQGRVEDDSEVLAIIHTRRGLVEQVM